MLKVRILVVLDSNFKKVAQMSCMDPDCKKEADVSETTADVEADLCGSCNPDHYFATSNPLYDQAKLHYKAFDSAVKQFCDPKFNVMVSAKPVMNDKLTGGIEGHSHCYYDCVLSDPKFCNQVEKRCYYGCPPSKNSCAVAGYADSETEGPVKKCNEKMTKELEKSGVTSVCGV